MTNMNHFIDPVVYGLLVDDGPIAYVGSTSKNATNRLWEHIYRARSGHTAPVYEWMRSVGVENVQVVVLAREPDGDTRKALEVATITQLLGEGHPLVNQLSRDGREGSMSAASRERISRAKAGRTTWIKGKRGVAAGWTPERRRKQSERLRRRPADASNGLA